MSSDLKKLFTTAENFKLLREKLGEYKKLPTEKEKEEFLEFLDLVYRVWKTKNPHPGLEKLEEKAKARTEIVALLGIRSD